MASSGTCLQIGSFIVYIQNGLHFVQICTSCTHLNGTTCANLHFLYTLSTCTNLYFYTFVLHVQICTCSSTRCHLFPL